MRCYLAGAYAECNREEASRCAHREENELSSGGTSSGGRWFGATGDEYRHYYPCIARAEGAMPCYWIGEREMRGRDARRGERLRARERRERTLDHKGVGECVRVFGVRPRGTSAGHPAEPGSSIKNKHSSSALHPLVARRPATTASPSGGDRTRRGSARSCVCAIISAASALLWPTLRHIRAAAIAVEEGLGCYHRTRASLDRSKNM